MATIELPLFTVAAITAVTTKARLLLLNRDPAPAEEEVPRDTRIAFELADTGVAGVDPASIAVWVDGAQVLADKAFAPAFSGSASAITTGKDTVRVTLDRLAPFASSTEVRVRVRARTLDGVAAIDESYAFAIEDRTAPKLLAVVARGPRALRLAFDESVLVPAAAAFTFAALTTPAVPITIAHASASGSLLDLEFSRAMSPDARYLVTVAGVTDLRGNPIEAPFDRAVFTGYRPPRPPNRRFDLWSMLPRHNRRADETGDLQKFVACLQEILDLQLAELDAFPDLFDLERAPEPWLDLILTDLGNPFSFDLDLFGKRRLAAALVDMYRLKGTAPGIRRALQFLLGILVLEITGLAATALVLGESELGVDWELGPSGRFARYAFSIRVNRVLTAKERRKVRTVVNLLKPAHTHFVDLLEPLPPPTFDHWELGVSEVGDTTLLH